LAAKVLRTLVLARWLAKKLVQDSFPAWAAKL
jgi:hypothetical protein